VTALAITEAEWQQQVVDLAHMLGWRHNHTRRSIGRGRSWTTATSVIGWPDLVMWSEAQRRVLYVELKSETGKLSFEQDIVLDSLRAAGCETFVWRPSDLEQVRDVLQGVAA
jgi:hypothetical protein